MPRGDRGGTSKGSGVRCVAFGCGKTSADGVSLHLFPKDPSLRRQWTEFVNTKRAKWPGPSEYSALCSVHFKPECYPFRHRFEMEHMGKLPKGAKVNEDAVPTIHSMNVDAQPQGESVEANSTPEFQTTPRHRMPRLEMLSPSEESTSQSSPPKKIRRGYAKRETARIIAAYEEEQASTSLNQPDQIESMAICEPEISVELEECGDQETEDLTACKVSFSCQVHLKPKQRSKHCQTRERPEKEYNKPVVKMVTRGVQTDPSVLTSKPQMQDAFQLVRPDYFDPPSKSKPPKKNVARESVSSLDEPFSSPMKDDLNDPMYEPLSSSSSDDEIPNDEQRNRHIPPEEQGKYIVFESNLLELFATCSKCASKTTGKIVYVNGSLVKIRQECKACIFVRTWFSQPYIGSKPAGNILISAGILFSGSVPSKALRMFKFMKISGISMSTFMSHQKFYLHPAIGHVWFNYQQDYVSDVNQQNRSVVLGGDGRADTPGHSAKYGSYTMLDLDEGVVVDIQLVQSNEVKSSAHMEKEGLIRSIRFFRHHTITIKSLITDRHVQIVKWVRENLTDTTHCFDVWHVAKGLKKKLFALSKEKDCAELGPWIKSLVNHLYWTAATSKNEDKDVIMAKWLSVLNHIINIHSGHSVSFPECQHENLEGRERNKKWLKPGTKVYEKLEEMLSSRQMKRDIPMLSSDQQTSALEGYHSVINHFAPKMIGFSYHGMLCRLWLAALHFNENSQREQAVTKEGKARFNIVYPKFKKGEYTVRKVPVEPTYDYIDTLMRAVFRIGEVSHMNEDGVQLLVDVPPPLCSEYQRPDKDAAIQSLLSRFNQCQPPGNQCSSGLDPDMNS